MFDPLINWFSNDLAIDLGTSNTRLFVRDRGIVSEEPSVVAVETLKGGRQQVLAVGRDAKDMLGRTPGHIQAIRPLKEGVISDFDLTSEMLRYFIQKGLQKSGWSKPRIVVCVPVGITEVEKRAVKEAAESANARDVYLFEEPMAAAIGSGMPITEPSGNMIMNIGGGTTEVAVISLGGIVFSRSLRVGGDKLDEAIMNHMKKRYSLLVGERSAEQIKMSLGSAFPDDTRQTIEVKGRDMIAGVPKTVEVTDEEIREALDEPVTMMCESLRISLERTPPELASDLVDRGIVLCGGGALLRNLDVRLNHETGLPIYISEEPTCGAVLGAGKALDNVDLLEQVSIGNAI